MQDFELGIWEQREELSSRHCSRSTLLAPSHRGFGAGKDRQGSKLLPERMWKGCSDVRESCNVARAEILLRFPIPKRHDIRLRSFEGGEKR